MKRPSLKCPFDSLYNQCIVVLKALPSGKKRDEVSQRIKRAEKFYAQGHEDQARNTLRRIFDLLERP